MCTFCRFFRVPFHSLLFARIIILMLVIVAAAVPQTIANLRINVQTSAPDPTCITHCS